MNKTIKYFVEQIVDEYFTNEAPKTKTRLLGTCGFCDRRFKAPKERLAFHGFERPGFGFTIGSCPGSHQKPFEISPVTAQLGVDMFKKAGKDLKKQLKKHATATVLTVPRRDGKGNRQVYKDEADPVDWRYLYDLTEEKLKRQIKDAIKLVKHFQKKVDNWQLSELGSVEEKQTEKKQRAEVVRQQKLERYTTNRDKTVKRLQDAFDKIKKAEAILKSTKDAKKIAVALVTANKAARIIFDTFASKPAKLIQNHPDLITIEDVYEDWNLQDMFKYMGLKTPSGYISRREARIMDEKTLGDYEEYYLWKGLDSWKPFWPGWKGKISYPPGTTGQVEGGRKTWQ